MTFAIEPKIAVLLATFNGDRFVGSQLSSIFAQRGVDVHVFVRDDKSSDNTIDEVVAFSDKFADRLTLLPDDDDEGGSAGRNFFALLRNVDFTKYDYIALSDQDDVWEPTKLISAVESLRINDASCYSSNLIAYDEATMRSWFVRKSGDMCAFDYLFQSASAGCTYVLNNEASALVQRTLREKSCALPTTISHDFVIYAICRSHCLKWTMDRRSYIFYRQHSSNVFSAMPGWWGLWQRWRLACRGWFRENILFLDSILDDGHEARKILARIRRFNLRDRFWLATKCRHFRRRRRDQIFLAITLLLGAL
jgi:rhamnosyltransferase